MFKVYDIVGTLVYEGNDAGEANAALMNQGGMGWLERDEATMAQSADTDVAEEAWSDETDAMASACTDDFDMAHDGADEDEGSRAMDDEDEDEGDEDSGGAMPLWDVTRDPPVDDDDDDEDMVDVTVPSLPDGTMAMAQVDTADTVDAGAEAAPVATVMQLSEEGTDAAMARARHEQLAKDLEATLGLAIGPSAYGAGVVLGDAGVRRFHASYDEWAKRPLFEDACGVVAGRVVEENRKDHIVHPARVTMTPEGLLTMGGGTGLRMEEAGFKMLLAQVSRGTKLRWSRFFGGDDIGLVFPRAYQLMAVMPTDLRATVWNRLIEGASGSQKLMFRTRQPDGQAERSLYAVASSTYGVFDADRVLGVLRGSMNGSGARGSIVYVPRTTALVANASWHADRVFDVASGDVMGLSVSFRSNDARSGAITAHASAECGFGRMTFGKELCRVRHIGSGMAYRASGAIHEAVGKARVAFGAFLSDWGHMAGTSVSAVKLWGTAHDTGLAVLDTMREKGVLTGLGLDDDGLKALCARGWAASGAGGGTPTCTHVVRALMAMAKDAVLDVEQQDTMERVAGDFVGMAARAPSA